MKKRLLLPFLVFGACNIICMEHKEGLCSGERKTENINLEQQVIQDLGCLLLKKEIAEKEKRLGQLEKKIKKEEKKAKELQAIECLEHLMIAKKRKNPDFIISDSQGGKNNKKQKGNNNQVVCLNKHTWHEVYTFWQRIENKNKK